MKKSNSKKISSAKRRQYRTRKKIFGTAERPRLSVFRSSRHIYAQIVDDMAGVTLASASSMVADLRPKIGGKGNVDSAKQVGSILAKQALGVGINCVTFDRNRYRYHGRVKALADAARKAGLVF